MSSWRPLRGEPYSEGRGLPRARPMTLSLLAADPSTGELGMVIASSSPAVAARCAYIRPTIGVAATQNVTDPRLGPALLDALTGGQDPEQAMATVRSKFEHIEYRQLAVVDRLGR